MFSASQISILNVDDGHGIDHVEVTYAVGDSPTTPPGTPMTDGGTVITDISGVPLTDGSWSATIPNVPNGKYLWTRTITYYSDGAFSIAYTVGYSGTNGSPGSQGLSIASEKEQWYLSDSRTFLTGGSWTYTEPSSIPEGKYLWGRWEFTMSDGSVQYSDSVYRSSISDVMLQVDQNTKAITQKVWASDITNSVSNYDATTGQSIRDRVTATETDISGIHTSISSMETSISTKADGSTVTTLSSQVNSIEDTVNSHTQSISNVTTRVNGLKIGSQNYLANSEIFDKTKAPYTSSTATPSTGNVKDGQAGYDTMNTKKIIVTFPTLVSGEEYMFSFDWCRPWAAQTLRTTIGGVNTDVTTTNDNIWHRQEIKFTASANTTRAEIFVISSSTAYPVYVRHFQLELGNIASDWHVSQAEQTEVITSTKTTADQTADHLAWIIEENGKTSSTFTFKSRVMELVNADLVIKDPAGSQTIISGGKITANSITTNMLATDAIKSSNYAVSSTSGSPFSATGSYLDLTTGNLYMPNFGVNGQTGAAYFNGTVNATAGQFGDSLSYWNIETVYDYNMQPHAALVGTGSPYLQTGNWQVSDNSIATRKYVSTSSTAGTASYYKDAGTNTFYDVGMKIPTNFTAPNASDATTVKYNKAFYYGRKYTGNNIPALDADWTYFFMVDLDGNIYENGTKLSEKYASISGVDGAYLPLTGGIITGNLTVSGTLTATASAASKLASSVTIQTNLASTSVASFDGSGNVSPGVTGTLGVGNGGTGNSSWTANGIVYASSSSALTQLGVGTSGYFLKSNGNSAPGWVNPSTVTVGNATKATQDASGNVITTTYRTLDNTTFEEADIESLTVEDIEVSGTATFTNGLSGNLTGTASEATHAVSADTATTATTATSATSAEQVTNNLKIQLNGGTTEGTNQFTYNGSAIKNINITKSSIGLGNVENTALSTWAGSANLTTASVGTLAAAATKGVDTSISSSSTNLPTSAAVAGYAVKGLSSGTTSGHFVSWGANGYTVADTGYAPGQVVKSIASNNEGKLVLTYLDDTTSAPIEVMIIGQSGSSVSFADALNVNGTAVGSQTQPVYFNNQGVPQLANKIPKLNNASSDSAFYAPTSVGTNGQYLKSNGSGAPSWATFSKSTVGLGNVDNTADANKNVLTATKFSSTRTISLTGDTVGSASSDGTSGWTISTDTIAMTAINGSGAAHSGSSDRPTSANMTFTDGALRYYLASAVMTEGKPAKDGHILHMSWDTSTTYDAQLAVLHDTSPWMQLRYKQGSGNWTDWITQLSASNFNNYAPALDGTGATGTWGISITGNASSATSATQDGSGNVIDGTYAKLSGATFTGAVIGTSFSATSYVRANGNNSGTTGGLTVWGTNPLQYGMAMRTTESVQNHGYVTGDYATYFSMGGSNATNANRHTRGWIFRNYHDDIGVASISGNGKAVFNGSVTVGGNTANTSGARLEFNSATKSLNFIFN